MNKYCVAYISFHDNILTQKTVIAGSEKEAVIKAFGLDCCFPTEHTTIEEAQNNAFDMDIMFSVIQVT